MENWKSIGGYEDLYWVSDLGRVKSVNGVMTGYYGKYHSVCFSKGKGQRTFNTHRLVAETFIGRIGPGMCVNHKDGNKYNNKLSNLEIVTNGENLKHAFRMGLRTKKGESHHLNKITENDFREIKKLILLGIPQKEIGRRFGIHQSTVSDIKTGRSWGWCE